MTEYSGTAVWECWAEPNNPLTVTGKSDKGSSVIIFRTKKGKVEGLAVHDVDGALQLVWGNVPASFLENEAKYQ